MHVPTRSAPGTRSQCVPNQQFQIVVQVTSNQLYFHQTLCFFVFRDAASIAQVECSKQHEMDQRTIGLIKSAVEMDFPIYDLAVRELQRKLDLQPPQFWEDLEKYRVRRTTLLSALRLLMMLKCTARRLRSRI